MNVCEWVNVTCAEKRFINTDPFTPKLRPGKKTFDHGMRFCHILRPAAYNFKILGQFWMNLGDDGAF